MLGGGLRQKPTSQSWGNPSAVVQIHKEWNTTQLEPDGNPANWILLLCLPFEEWMTAVAAFQWSSRWHAGTATIYYNWTSDLRTLRIKILVTRIRALWNSTPRWVCPFSAYLKLISVSFNQKVTRIICTMTWWCRTLLIKWFPFSSIMRQVFGGNGGLG